MPRKNTRRGGKQQGKRKLPKRIRFRIRYVKKVKTTLSPERMEETSVKQ